MKTNNTIDALKPEILFVILIIISGMISIILIPVGAGFDEDTHLARIWEMSGGTLIPNQELGSRPDFPSIFFELSYRQKFIVEPVSDDFIKEYLNTRINWDVMTSRQTYSIYFPTLYLTQAFIMGLLGRLFDAPVLIIYFFCRLSYLLIYTILTFFAIKVIPYGKWMLMLLALSPMAIFQASTITPDAVSNSMSFLFLAWMIKFSGKAGERLSTKEIFLTFFLIAALFTLKPNSAALILLFFLIPISRFSSKRRYLFIALGIIILFIILVVGWNYLTSSQLSGNDAGAALQQAKFIIQHPFEYIRILFRNFSERYGQYYKEWVGVFGFRYWVMPLPVYILFFVLSALSISSETSDQVVGLRERLILIVTFVIGYIFTITLLYLGITSVGAQSVLGVQGRYFIPFMPAFLLVFRNKNPILSQKRFKTIFFPGLVVLLIIFLAGMYLSYHVNCGTKYYTSGYCYQPIYKNWDPDNRFSEEITPQITIEQDFIVKCNNMEEFRVWMDRPAQPGATTMIILSDSQSGRKIFETRLENESIPSKGWQSFDIPVELSSQDRQYKASFLSHDAGDHTGAVIGVSSREEYTEGQLLINGTPVSYDILFQYGCRAGLMLMDK